MFAGGAGIWPTSVRMRTASIGTMNRNRPMNMAIAMVTCQNMLAPSPAKALPLFPVADV